MATEDLLNDTTNDSLSSWVQAAYQKILDTYRPMLASMGSLTTTSTYLPVIILVVETIQMVGIFFPRVWSGVIIPWSTLHARPVAFFCGLFSEDLLDQVGIPGSAPEIAITLVAILIGTIVAIGLMSSVLFVPIVRVLIITIRDGSAMYVFLGIVAIVPNVFLCGSFIHVVYDMNPLSKSMRARSHARIDLLYVGSKVTLLALSQTSFTAAVFSAIASFLSFVISYLFTMYPPYYDYLMSQYVAASSWIVTWTGLSALVAAIYNNEASGGAVFMFLGGAPVVVFASYLIVVARIDYLKTVPLEQLRNQWEIEIRYHLSLQERDRTFRDDVLLAKHVDLDRDSCDNDVVIDVGNGTSQEDDRDELFVNENETKYASCKHILDVGLARFPESGQLLISAAHFCIEIIRVNFVAYGYLDRALSLDPKIDQQFDIYRLQKTIADRILQAESNREAVQYNVQCGLYTKAQSLDLSIVEATLSFWSEVMKSKPDHDKMRELAIQISNESKTAYASYAKAIAISDDSVSSLQSYSGFVLTVMRDPRHGERLLERAAVVQDAQSKIKHAMVFKDLLFEDRVAVFVISGAMCSLGNILDCNSRAAQTVGMSKATIIGKNIRIFSPEPFSSQHDALMTRNLKSGYQTVVDNKRNFVIMHQSGYIQDMNLFVKVFVKDFRALSFIGVIEVINPDSLLLVYDRCNVIRAISRTVSVQFAVGKEQVDSNSLRIDQLIPDVESHWKTYRTAVESNPDFVRSINLNINDANFVLGARFSKSVLMNDEYAMVLRLTILSKRIMSQGGPLEPLPETAVPSSSAHSSSVSRSASDASSSEPDRSSTETDSATDRGGASGADEELDEKSAVRSGEHISHEEESKNAEQSAQDLDIRSHPTSTKSANVEESIPSAQASNELIPVGSSDQKSSYAGDDVSSTSESRHTSPSYVSDENDDRSEEEGGGHIEPFYPTMTKRPLQKGEGAAAERGGSRSLQDAGHVSNPPSEITSRASNVSHASEGGELANDIVQKRLEMVLMKWLQRTFLAVFLLLAILSLGQVFVADQIVQGAVHSIELTHHAGELSLDVLNVAQLVQNLELIHKGLLHDHDGVLTQSLFHQLISASDNIIENRRDILDLRLQWSPATMRSMADTIGVRYRCTDGSACNFAMVALDYIGVFAQLAREIASTPANNLDRLPRETILFILRNVGNAADVSNVLSHNEQVQAEEQNALLLTADLVDIIVQILASIILLCIAMRATIIGVQLRNDHALMIVYRVPSREVNRIMAPFADRLAILQMNAEDAAETADEMTSNRISTFDGDRVKERGRSDSSRRKRLQRIDVQISKSSKHKTRRLMRYTFQLGQLAILYLIFFTYRRINIIQQAAIRKPIPMRFQYGFYEASKRRRAVLHMQQLLIVSGDMLLTASPRNRTASLRTSIEDELTESDHLRKVLTFGGELDGDYQEGSLNAGPGHFDLEFSNMCLIPGITVPDCETYSDGLARSGRQAMAVELVWQVHRVMGALDFRLKAIMADPSFTPGSAARDDFMKRALANPEGAKLFSKKTRS